MNENLVNKSLALAENLQNQVNALMSEQEKTFHDKMEKLLRDPKNKVMLIELLDRSFRCGNKGVSYELICHILDKYGVSDFFTAYEKFLLKMFLTLGGIAPNMSVPFFVNYLRKDTSAMVLDENPEKLSAHTRKRKSQNITINVNLIGEEVLGEDESKHRLDKYEKALKSDYIEYISIKITTIFSQINIIDFKYSKDEIVKRLDYLYAIAAEQKAKGKNKFINLDMEEFRDLELTVAAFMESLDKYDIEAGIVLQAYLPDSYDYLKKLHAFSKERVKAGKPAIKIRYVKGANMESEETIASQRGWALPTFKKKVDTDSNYNKMLHFLFEDENFKYIKVGIASHNIFEIAYAYTLMEEYGAQDCFTFEMLEGMSLGCSEKISSMHKLILYAPVCDDEHFNNAIAYLVRRLDENTSEDNFMRHYFNIKVGDSKWNDQKQIFLDSLKGIDKIDNSTRRTQNRLNEQYTKSSYETDKFANEPDTDFILKANREWANKIVEKYTNLPEYEVYPEVGVEYDKSALKSVVISDNVNNKKIADLYLADENLIKKSLEVAKEDKSGWSQKSHEEIYAIFAKVVQNIKERRNDLIGISALEVGKTFLETDPEVSEAIDFCEFYPHSLRELKKQNKHTKFTAKGVGVVIAPWNFPVGISIGTIAAPLAAGNRVIYKPSSLSSLTGYEVCKVFWDAGVPKDALIYLPCKGSDVSKYLLVDEAVKFCVFTGGEETAYKMLEARPTLMLSAETGGKNATIVSRLADRDSAAKNIIHSAFSNSGQKCSATSLLVLEEEVYNDEGFKKTLVDAAKSMATGSPFVLKNKIGTLAQEPEGKVEYALSHLEPHEEWVLKPTFVDGNKKIMTPGIKYGTKEGDFTHKNELFVPILTVMKARDIKHAVEIVNNTGYGLTGAFESLDEREWQYYLDNIEVGNCYINKPSTGAIVLRQPFGGMKKSAIGLGRKVGIYNYMAQFLDIEQNEADENLQTNEISKKLDSFSGDDAVKNELKKASLMAQSYAYHYKNEFSQEKDYVKIRGEDNIFRYYDAKNIAYRVYKDDTISDILGIIIAANTINVKVYVSYENPSDALKFVKDNLSSFGLKAEFIEQDDNAFANDISKYDRLRYLATPDVNSVIYKSAARNAKVIASVKPLINGRFELLNYYYEQACSISFHRYGNLGSRILK